MIEYFFCFVFTSLFAESTPVFIVLILTSPGMEISQHIQRGDRKRATWQTRDKYVQVLILNSALLNLFDNFNSVYINSRM